MINSAAVIPIYPIRFLGKLALSAAILFMVGSIHTVNGQKKKTFVAREQISFTCDNNFFLFNGDDGYYTSGVFLRYDRLVTKPSAKAMKRIASYEIGQKMYTAHSRKILPGPTPNSPDGLDQIDRPIAGNLYGKATLSTLYSHHTLLAMSLSIGTIGENSFGSQTYAFWHQVIGVKEHWNWVWEYQVKGGMGMNVHATFAQSLIGRERPLLQITPITKASLGTHFTDLSQEVLIQLGKLQTMASSSYWHTRLQTGIEPEENRRELFLYYKPTLRYQLYNATIEGGMFSNDKGPIVAEPEPLVFAHEIGIQFSTPRYSLAYQVVFQSKEAKGQFYNQSHGSLFVALRFR